MSIIRRSVNKITIIDVSGRLTIGQAVIDLKTAVSESLDAGSRKIVLNLAEVTYMDSSGIGQLIGSMKETVAFGGKLKLLNVNSRVNGLLRLTNVVFLFESFDDEAAAIQSFG